MTSTVIEWLRWLVEIIVHDTAASLLGNILEYPGGLLVLDAVVVRKVTTCNAIASIQ